PRRTSGRAECDMSSCLDSSATCSSVFYVAYLANTMPRKPDDEGPGVKCVCDLCGRRYPYDRRKGHTKQRCNSCRSNSRRPPGDVKRLMVDYKGGHCEACGYDRCLAALCFHHRNPNSKRFAFAGGHNRS